MSHERTIDELPVVDQPACIYLRSKAIYVTGDIDPKHLDEIGSHEFACWCNRTQHSVGPDEGFVDRRSCVPQRECYQAAR